MSLILILATILVVGASFGNQELVVRIYGNRVSNGLGGAT